MIPFIDHVCYRATGTKTERIFATVMPPEDKALLDTVKPDLMDSLDLKGSNILSHLSKRNVLRTQQVEIIEVVHFSQEA